MSKKDPRLIRTLRALRGGDSADTVDEVEAPVPADDARVDDAKADQHPQQGVGAVAELEDAIASLEDKLSSGAGIDGLAHWLREVESAVTALENSGLDQTRDDIRSVIDRLLGINAEIQNVVRLKKLLS